MSTALGITTKEGTILFADQLTVMYNENNEASESVVDVETPKMHVGTHYALVYAGLSDARVKRVMQAFETGAKPEDFLECTDLKSEYVPTTHALERITDPEKKKLWELQLVNKKIGKDDKVEIMIATRDPYIIGKKPTGFYHIKPNGQVIDRSRKAGLKYYTLGSGSEYLNKLMEDYEERMKKPAEKLTLQDIYEVGIEMMIKTCYKDLLSGGYVDVAITTPKMIYPILGNLVKTTMERAIKREYKKFYKKIEKARIDDKQNLIPYTKLQQKLDK